MKQITLLLIISIIMGCDIPNKDDNGHRAAYGIQLLTLRGCEYALFKDINGGVSMVHHADCHNPHHYGEKTFQEKMDSLSKAIKRTGFIHGGIPDVPMNNTRQTARIVYMGFDSIGKEMIVPYYPDTTAANKELKTMEGGVIATGKQDTWIWVGQWVRIKQGKSQVIVVIDK